MGDIAKLDNGKLIIISLEKRGDSIIRQETVYTRRTTNKIRKVFKEEANEILHE